MELDYQGVARDQALLIRTFAWIALIMGIFATIMVWTPAGASVCGFHCTASGVDAGNQPKGALDLASKLVITKS